MDITLNLITNLQRYYIFFMLQTFFKKNYEQVAVNVFFSAYFRRLFTINVQNLVSTAADMGQRKHMRSPIYGSCTVCSCKIQKKSVILHFWQYYGWRDKK